MREQRDWMKIYLFKTIHREYNFVVMSTWHYKYEKCLVVSGLSQCSLAHCRYTQTGVSSPTRQGRRRSGAATTDHGPGPPRTGPEPPRAGPGPLQVEAGPPGGLSHQASQAQASGPPLPARAGVRSRHVPLWARPPTPGSGAATCPTGADLRTSAPCSGRGPEPPRPPLGVAADPWVRCRHMSHKRESSA